MVYCIETDFLAVSDLLLEVLMHKYLTAVLAILISLMLVACEGARSPLPSAELSPSPEVVPKQSVPFPEQETSDKLDEADIDNDERAAIFRAFLTERYNELTDSLYGGIAGVGFIDLDCDGGMEMLLFDAGASASMGVQFFDIIDGEVECISANIFTVGESFGGDHFTETYVNANLFEDFRLMEDKQTGERFFLVTSGNGAIDFSYTELIKFSADSEVLTLTSITYKHEELDEESGEIKSVNYKVGDKDATEQEYIKVTEKIYLDAEDTGLEAKGVFAWESDSYVEGLEGLLAMEEKALSLADNQKNLY